MPATSDDVMPTNLPKAIGGILIREIRKIQLVSVQNFSEIQQATATYFFITFYSTRNFFSLCTGIALVREPDEHDHEELFYTHQKHSSVGRFRQYQNEFMSELKSMYDRCSSCLIALFCTAHRLMCRTQDREN